MTAVLGERLGKYILLRAIGTGDVAQTYRARVAVSSGVDRVIALKVLDTQYARDGAFVKAFLGEASAAINLSHKHIAQVYEAKAVGEAVYLASEYVEGRRLADLASRCDSLSRPLSPRHVTEIVAHAASALHHAHKQRPRGRTSGFLHREVSPSNILVSFEGEVKVVDFGIARAKEHLTQTQAGLNKSKCEYMAPEQIAGRPLDGRSDLFSLGIVLWELLAHRRLFAANTDYATVRNIMKMEIPRVRSIHSAVPKALDDAVARALSREPSERFASAGELHRELVRLLEEMPGDETSLRTLVGDVYRDEMAQTARDQIEEREAFLAIIEGKRGPGAKDSEPPPEEPDVINEEQTAPISVPSWKQPQVGDGEATQILESPLKALRDATPPRGTPALNVSDTITNDEPSGRAEMDLDDEPPPPKRWPALLLLLVLLGVGVGLFVYWQQG